ncbi:hypothetical protein LUW75_07550 [Streptomyces sp. MRC013]|uniref:hypothetical protein n=1 Tax=Streptomyces sp. MRC013 TaxID=2898276 RepID=UPI002025EA83|nr:hypothetical protein [Streptomyces sp. MRC013]URM89871.1 hypothetical protein LUW75_07550 [Streptomyces sp. MRC013]
MERNYSETNSGDTAIKTCDMEADQNSVEAQYVRTGGDTVNHLWDHNGAGPDNCVRSGTGKAINKHRTCEQRFAWPDVCGSWAYRP